MQKFQTWHSASEVCMGYQLTILPSVQVISNSPLFSIIFSFEFHNSVASNIHIILHVINSTIPQSIGSEKGPSKQAQ